MAKKSSTWKLGVAVCFAVLVVPAVASASGDGDMSHVYTNALWQAVNLAIFLGIGIWYGRKGVGKMLRDRRTTLMADLNEAKRLREEARAMLENYEAKVAALEVERTAILDEYREMGATESRRLIESARSQAAKIAKDAQQTVASEIGRAKATLEAEVLALAAELAREAISERLTKPRQDALVDQYIKDIETHFDDGTAAP